jgi:hypothetical protein
MGIFGDAFTKSEPTHQNVVQTFNMKAINKSIYNEFNRTETIAQASLNNVQKMKIVVYGSVTNCNIRGTQTIDATTQASVAAMINKTSEVKAKITNEMQQAASAAIEKTAELGNLADLGLGGGSNMDIKQDLTMEVHNIVQTEIENINIAKAIAEQMNIQDEEIIIHGDLFCRADRDDGIDLSQNITAQIAANAISDQIVKVLVENDITNKLSQEAAATAKKTDGGLAGLAKGVGEAYANVIDSVLGPISGGNGQMASMASSFICCIAIVAALVFFMSPAGQGASKNLLKRK